MLGKHKKMQNCIKTVKKKKKKHKTKFFNTKDMKNGKESCSNNKQKRKFLEVAFNLCQKYFVFPKETKKKITSKSVLAYVFECVCVFEVEKFVKFNTTTNCLIVSVFVSVCLVHFTSTNYSARRLFT